MFVNNPQYALSVREPTQIRIKAETDPQNAIQLMLFESGKDVTQANFAELMANRNGGSFQNGFSYLETVVDPGEYTLVLCPQEQRQKGGFRIEVGKVKKGGKGGDI